MLKIIVTLQSPLRILLLNFLVSLLRQESTIREEINSTRVHTQYTTTGTSHSSSPSLQYIVILEYTLYLVHYQRYISQIISFPAVQSHIRVHSTIPPVHPIVHLLPCSTYSYQSTQYTSTGTSHSSSPSLQYIVILEYTVHYHQYISCFISFFGTYSYQGTQYTTISTFHSSSPSLQYIVILEYTLLSTHTGTSHSSSPSLQYIFI